MAIKINGITVAGMSSKVQIDDTLTISGAAADAKAVGDVISTKQDRIDSFNWYPSTLPSNSTWEAIAYGNGMFVSIANESNKTAYSTDGEHWTETTNLPSESSWYSITYGNGNFVAVAYGTVAAYSTDGITWTAATLPSSRNWCSVAYGNGIFVAIAGSSNVAAYSTDGINWQLSNITVGVSWESVAYGNGMFVAIENGTNVAAYSTDGINWSAGTLPQSTRWRSLTYGNGRFVAVAYNTNIAAYSTDGIHWTESTLPTTTYWCSVAYGNGIFVVVTYNKTISAYSTDGENWTEITLPHSSYGFAATYGNGIFAAVGYSTDRAIYAKMPAVLTSSFESDVKGIVGDAIATKVDTAGVTSWNDLTDKPFYEDFSGECLVKDYRFKGTFEMGSVSVEIPDVQLHDGITYTATIDGEIFTNTASTWKDCVEFTKVIDDKMVYVKTTSNGIELTYTDGVVDGDVRDLVFSMWVGDDKVVKTLDEKYIPDTIARVGDVANKVNTTGDTMTGDLTIDGGTESKAFTVKRTVSDVVGEAKLNVTSMSSAPVAGLTLVHNGSSQAGIYVKKDQVTFYNHKTGNSYEMLHKGNISPIIEDAIAAAISGAIGGSY